MTIPDCVTVVTEPAEAYLNPKQSIDYKKTYDSSCGKMSRDISDAVAQFVFGNPFAAPVTGQ